MQIVDSHCHLDRLDLEKIPSGTLDQVVVEAADNNVDYMLCVGIDVDNPVPIRPDLRSPTLIHEPSF